MNASTIEGLVTRDQLAEQLGVCIDTLVQWSRRDYGPRPIKFGGRIRYRTSDVTSFLATLTGEPVG